MALFNKSAKKSSAAPASTAAVAATATTPAVKKRTSVDAAERQRMIGEAAYYLAEKRNFAQGHHDADWAAAEQQIDAQLAKLK